MAEGPLAGAGLTWIDHCANQSGLLWGNLPIQRLIETPRRSALLTASCQQRPSRSGCRGFLDRGKFPLPRSTRPDEGPQLGRLRRLARIPLDDPARLAIAHHVAALIAHRNGGIVGIALPPRLGEVALEKADVAHLV